MVAAAAGDERRGGDEPETERLVQRTAGRGRGIPRGDRPERLGSGLDDLKGGEVAVLLCLR